MHSRLALLACCAALAAALGRHHHHREALPCFSTPIPGLFVQERAAAALPAPGQHPAFGAVLPWADIKAKAVACAPSCRLLFFIRHAQAVSNAVAAAVGVDVWESDIAHRCAFNGTTLFDAELTAVGRAQAAALGVALASSNLTAGLPPAAAVVSPLTRTLATADAALGAILPLTTPFHVTELARERVGRNTCDARRPASDGGASPCGRVATGLRSTFAGPRFEHAFVIVPSSWWPPRKRARAWRPPSRLGLAADADVEWTRSVREPDAALAARARALLATIWRDTPAGAPVFVVAHSGIIPALLTVAGREPYPPQNAELMPALVQVGEC